MVEKTYLDHLKGRTTLTTEQFRRLFNHYDKDRSGTIAGPELRAFAWDGLRSELKPGQGVETITLAQIIEREAIIVGESEARRPSITPDHLASLLGLDPAAFRD